VGTKGEVAICGTGGGPRSPGRSSPRKETCMHLYQEIVPPLSKMLGNMNAWLDLASDHGEKKKFDPTVLLASRLAPDMYPLRRQIQAACDQAKFTAARATGRDAPKHEDGEQSMDELRARIADVRAYLGTYEPSSFHGLDDKVITLPYLPGKGIVVRDYVHEQALPNFYFHASMAYAILRHNGVDVGKRQFIGSLSVRDL
jgi:uncharacterized protein